MPAVAETTAAIGEYAFRCSFLPPVCDECIMRFLVEGVRSIGSYRSHVRAFSFDILGCA